MPRRLPRITDFLVATARRLFAARPPKSRLPRSKRPVRCWFERLEAREVFNATFHGGALIPHVEAQAVFLGSQWNSNTTLEAEKDSINTFLGGVVQSPFMDMLTDAGYNVGQGTYTPGKVINTTVTGTITDATIRSLLQAAINFEIDGKPAGLVEQPDANRLYIVYTPSGVTVNDNGATSQTSFLGYHGAFAGTDVYGVPFDIHYVVVPHPGAPNSTSTTNGFIGVSDAQVLALGGTSGGTLLPTFNGVTATTAITRTDEQQTVTIGGSTTDGSFKLAYNGVAATIAATPGNVQTLTIGGSVIGSLTLSYNGVSATSLTAKNEVQTLTIGDMSAFTLSFNGTSGSTATKLTQVSTAADVLAHLNSISALNGNVAVAGNAGGPFTITFQAALSADNVSQLVPSDPYETVTTVTNGLLSGLTADQVQTDLNTIPALSGNVAVAGNAGGPFTITFGGNLGSGNVSQLVAATTGGTTASVTSAYAAANLQASLNSIPALNNNVTVTGVAGGPFTITFVNALTGVNVTQLTLDSTTGAVAPTIATSKQGAMPTAAQVQSSLNGIAALTNNVTVTGSDGGPFTIAIKNLTTIPLLDVSTVTGGLTASISQGTGPGNSADLDQLTAVTSHELAEAVTDPNVNYKTLGWYDAVNNVEIADLPNAAADIPNITVRLNSFLTQKVYDQSVNKIAPDTTSTPFPSNNAQLQNVTAQQISLTRALVSWTPVPGAIGYRVLQVNNGQTTLLSRVPAMQNGNPTSSTVLTGLQQAGSLTLRVEAYNAANITAPAGVQLTMTLSSLTAPQSVVASQLPKSTSALITWIGNPGAAGYRVLQVVGTKKTLFGTLGEGATSIKIMGLKTNTTLTFIVEAFRGSLKADSVKANLRLNPLGIPSDLNFSVIPQGGNSFQLMWDTISAAKGYRVFRMSAGGRRILVTTLGASTNSSLSLTVSGFAAGTKFQLEAFNGNQVLDSPWKP